MLKELFKGMLKPTPKHFKKVRNIGLSLVVIAAGMWIIHKSYPDSVLVGLLLPYLPDIGATGAIMALIAQATEDPTKLQSPKKD